jgi:DNA-binding NarL/FixJ family response regulator
LIDKAKNLNNLIFTREKSGLLSTKAEQLEWRRTKAIELRARGMTNLEIAHELQVSRNSGLYSLSSNNTLDNRHL